jgi:hypothetical protein
MKACAPHLLMMVWRPIHHAMRPAPGLAAWAAQGLGGEGGGALLVAHPNLACCLCACISRACSADAGLPTLRGRSPPVSRWGIPQSNLSKHPLWHGHHVLRTAGNQGGFAPMMGLQTGRLRR